MPLQSSASGFVTGFCQGIACQRQQYWQADITHQGTCQDKIVLLRTQGHVDMVTEKNADVVHDFHKDALKLVRAGDWLKVRICLSARLS